MSLLHVVLHFLAEVTPTCIYVDMYVLRWHACMLTWFFVWLLLCIVELVRRRGVCEVGEPCDVVADYDLSETVKVFLVTLPYQHINPIHVEMRIGGGANDQFDVLLFVVSCISLGLLVRGDVLVIDNASIHKSQDILPPLQRLLQTAGVTLWFLPTYSPSSTHVNMCLRSARGTCDTIGACITLFGMR